jgi:two-component system, NtrC family, sensor kinase
VRFSEATTATLDDLEARLDRELRSQTSIEDAAQRTCDLVYERFASGAVLVRTFVTTTHARLPPDLQDAARGLLQRRARGTPITPDMPVLALLGSRGVRDEWNSRHRSQGHAAIPLASPEFVESIPMIARLLKQLGAGIGWVQGLDTAVLTHSLGAISGLFYVEDARTELDESGRKVISAQDFVEEHGIRTVFGFGGVYAVERTVLVNVVFTRETIPRISVERFMRLTNTIKAATLRLALDRRMFAEAVPVARRPPA